MPEFKRIELDEAPISALAEAALREGYAHIDRLIENWGRGSNRFDRQGEALLAAFNDSEMIAIGGLNRDPYATDPLIGRVRHLYVMPMSRRMGVGRRLVAEIVDVARESFNFLRVRAAKGDAPLFYDSIGFQRSDDPYASHLMKL